MRAESDVEKHLRLRELRTHKTIGNSALRKSIGQLNAGNFPHIGAKQELKGLRSALRAGAIEVIDITAPFGMAADLSTGHGAREGSIPSGGANFNGEQ